MVIDRTAGADPGGPVPPNTQNCMCHVEGYFYMEKRHENHISHTGNHVSNTAFLACGGGGGDGLYWCINEAWKCERRGLGASPPWPPPPSLPQKFFEDLTSLAKFDKFNAYAHQGCI